MFFFIFTVVCEWWSYIPDKVYLIPSLFCCVLPGPRGPRQCGHIVAGRLFVVYNSTLLCILLLYTTVHNSTLLCTVVSIC